MDIGAFDLNLIRVLLAVADESSVSLAARKLGLSQPAASSAINRLRAALDDPVIVRTRTGVVLTSRAQQFAQSAEAALTLISTELTAPRDFDPATSKSQFTILMSEIGDVVATPDLIQEVRTRAPGITLKIKAFSGRSYMSELETGEADLIFGDLQRRHDALMSTHLYKTPFVCLYRGGHPLAGKMMSAEDYYDAEHLTYVKDVRRISLRALSERGAQRKVALTLPHYIGIPGVLAKTDLIATVTEGLAKTFVSNHELAYQPLPFDVPPFSVSIFWHPRANNDQAHQWLRNLFCEIFRSSREGSTREHTRVKLMLQSGDILMDRAG